MIEEGVHDDAGAERECKQVGDGVCRGEVEASTGRRWRG